MKTIPLLKEKAIANIELLFIYWKIDYKKISDEEFDFITPFRKDNNFGACRFNIKKGLGADFTGSSFTAQDYRRVSPDFDPSDFSSGKDGNYKSFGLDIIGLCQRIHGCDTYKQAAYLLDKQLQEIASKVNIKEVGLKDVYNRQRQRDEERKGVLRTASKVWNLCVPLHKTIGEKYLNNRGIDTSFDEPNIRFHSKILNTELNIYSPALLFKVSKTYGSSLEAIHRIYLNPNTYKKASMSNPKKALGNIKGLGIWFGTPSDTLCIAEGPENALSIRTLGYDYVVSAIDAANFSNIYIDEHIKKIILFPDGDDAGKKSAQKALEVYSQTHSDIKVNFPPSNNNPKWDWNDELINIINRGKNV